MTSINATSESVGTGNLVLVEDISGSIDDETLGIVYIRNVRNFGAPSFEWEYANATYANNVIIRNSTSTSSNNNNPVDFSVGTKILVFDTVRVHEGEDGQIYTSNGSAAVWQTPVDQLSPYGTDKQVFTSNGTAGEWKTRMSPFAAAIIFG
jgi:hypothetical protein